MKFGFEFAQLFLRGGLKGVNNGWTDDGHTDDRAFRYYKLTYKPKGQVSLKRTR